MPRTTMPLGLPAHTAMPIGWVPLADLRPHPRNDGSHPAEELAHLTQSLAEHGVYRNVVLAEDGTILAGHGVVAAARALGHTQILARRLPYAPDDPRALKILVGDNHIARLRLQDEAALVALLQDLTRDDPLALLGTGFDADALAALVEQQGMLGGDGAGGNAGRDVEPQIDRAQELQKQWQTEVGQLWACGEHRLICGDCTDKAAVERLLGPAPVALALVDPPYNVDFAYTDGSHGDSKTPMEYQEFTQAWFHLCRHLAPRQIVTPGCNNLASWLQWFPAFYVACWIKTNAMTHGYVSRFFCWEPILFLGGQWFCGDESLWPRRRASDVFDYPISAQYAEGLGSLSPYHPCPKPLKLWEDLLESYSRPRDPIYDGFVGSGTTLVACENLQRVAYCCEINPGYVAVTLQRWADLTGATPTLLES